MKLFYKILSILCVMVLIVSPAIITASAGTGLVFTVPMSKPSTGDNQGFVEIYYKSSDGVDAVSVVAWNITYAMPESFDTSMVKIEVFSNRVNIRPIVTSESGLTQSTNAYMNYLQVNSTYWYNCGKLLFGEDWGENESIDVCTDARKVYYVKAYGNAYIDRSEVGGNTQYFSVLYAESASIYNELLSVVTKLNSIYSTDVQMLDKISSILNSSLTIEQKLDNLLAVLYSQLTYMGSDLQANADKNASQIQANQDKNTDKVINAGENVAQPGFDSTNTAVDDTTNTMNSIEGQYKIDATATQAALSEGTTFLSGTDMQRASFQVKDWIERFTTDNKIITGFLISAMVLGLCFWVIGRKSF